MDRLDTNNYIPIKLLSYRQYINLATMNVITLRKTTQRQELAALTSEFQIYIYILGLVDYKIVHNEETNIEKYGDYTRITTSSWRS